MELMYKQITLCQRLILDLLILQQLALRWQAGYSAASEQRLLLFMSSDIYAT